MYYMYMQLHAHMYNAIHEHNTVAKTKQGG